MISLGIETSCDDTSVGIVKEGTKVLACVTQSSEKFHKKFGGIVPEIAHRKHLEFIDKVLIKALEEAKLSLKQIDLICVTSEPGLVGSLLIGINFAKALSFSLKKPLILVNHLHAHLYPVFFRKIKPTFPFIGLVASGGHTNLFLVENFDKIYNIGKTRDDAVGEAFDKVAKILGLGFPGGPLIDKFSKNVKKTPFKFPYAKLEDSLDFSFSGIKTAVFYKIKELKNLTTQVKRLIAAGFQKSVIENLVYKCKLALKRYNIKTLVVGGGVAANSLLRKELNLLKKDNIKVHLAPLKYCTDNGANTAGLGYKIFSLKCLAY